MCIYARTCVYARIFASIYMCTHAYRQIRTKGMLTYTHVSVCAHVCLGVYSVCVCLRVYTYTQTYIHICTLIYTCSYMQIHTHIHINKCRRVNAYRCTRVCTYDVYAQVCMHVYAYGYVYAYICTYLCVYMHTYMYTCIHTYVRTHRRLHIAYVHTDV